MQKVSKKRWLILLTLFLPFLFFSSPQSTNPIVVPSLAQHNSNARHQNNFSYHNLELGMYNSGLITTSPFGEDLLFLWGSNIKGQLGSGNASEVTAVQPVNIAENHFQQLALGSNDFIGYPNHSGLITIDEENKNHLYMWGNNAQGQIGNNSKTDIYQPLEIDLPEDNIKKIDLGTKHSGAITTDQEGHDHLYMWGDNAKGALGTSNNLIYIMPKEVILPEKRIKDLSLGASFTGVITTDDNNVDHLYMWGENRDGKIGVNNTTTQSFNTPQEITTLNETTIEEVSLGSQHVGVITKDDNDQNHLYMWGSNTKGQLGNGNTTKQASPVEITGFNNWALRDLELGYLHSGIIANDGNNDYLFMWGSNENNSLTGDTSSAQFTSPNQVTLANNKIHDLALGAQHTGIITLNSNNEEEVYMWGDNTQHQIDYSTNNNYLTPTQINTEVPVLPTGIEIINEEVDTTLHKATFTFSLDFEKYSSISEILDFEDLVMTLDNAPEDSTKSLTWVDFNNQGQLIGKVTISNLLKNNTYSDIELTISSTYHNANVNILVPVFTTRNFSAWVWIAIFVGGEIGLIMIGWVTYKLMKAIFQKNK